MQDYKAIDENENMSDAPAQMAKNDKAIISNFSGAEEPNTKIQGQFWFDTSTNKLQFYNGSKFVTEIPCNITGIAARAKADESGRVIADTYLMKSEAKTNYLGVADKAVSAATADKAKALHTLERNTAYKVGDIAYTEQLSAGYYLECITAGTTGDSEPSISVESENVNDGTVKWGVKNIQDASKLGLPVGFETFTINPNLQAGWLPLLGGEYSRTAYADLWAWVQTQNGYLIEESAWQAKAAANGGNVPFYSKGDGSTTFRVPALKCWVRGAGSISEVGSYLAAGLPNITGSTAWAINGTIGAFSSQGTPYHQNTGALSVKTDGKAYGAIGDTGADSRKSNVSANIDASLSNPIYGSSDTVQPPSIVGLWCVKAYGTVTNVGSTDVANISTGLTQAETRITRLENSKVDKAGNAWVVESYRNDTEWYRVWSDGWLEQGGRYQAPSTGIMTITFLKPFTDANYTLSTQTGDPVDSNWYSNAASAREFQAGQYATTHFKKFMSGKNTDEISLSYCVWYACGQGA